MEHIGRVLQNLSPGRTTPNQKTTEEKELTLDEKREQLRKSLGLSNLENTFENFKPAPGAEKALAAFKSLASGQTDWKMLLVYGGVGNGKTHLCEAAAISLYERGLFCRVLTMARIMGALKECIGDDSKISLEELQSNYWYAERLILDDVEGTEWEFEQLEKIIVTRYRERLFTIITTNRNISELPERITSRFFDPEVGRVVLNEAGDFRKSKFKELITGG